ncbi:MAG: CobD/CbiB family protein [Gallionella sp.]|jgi:adenosylcobinamide-phosphate synthase|nr:CobD/CbiB family protein [Gallionella sp.]
MSLFALIAALSLEQFHPLSQRKYLFGWLSRYVDFFQRHFNAGEHKHGKIAWLLAVLPLLLVMVGVYWVLQAAHPILAWAFNVLVLYLTMGFRQFSHYFTDIHKALRADNLDEARRLLAAWRNAPAHELNAEEVARLSIEEALLASHRKVFGVIVWFVVFSLLGLGGAAGALLYRMGQFLRARWGDEAEFGDFTGFARQAFDVLEWLPVRLTAITFAIVGDFEDTLYCWRSQAGTWPDKEAGILLASGAGSLGVRLGMIIPQDGLPLDRPELGLGDDADADFMQSAIGLVWRSVVFWLLLMLMLSLANLLG